MDGALARLRRWEESGATWRVLVRTAGDVEIALLSCDAGEEMDRLRSADADLLDYVDRHGPGAESIRGPH